MHLVWTHRFFILIWNKTFLVLSLGRLDVLVLKCYLKSQNRILNFEKVSESDLEKIQTYIFLLLQ